MLCGWWTLVKKRSKKKCEFESENEVKRKSVISFETTLSFVAGTRLERATFGL
jgi:hypothetical protein